MPGKPSSDPPANPVRTTPIYSLAVAHHLIEELLSATRPDIGEEAAEPGTSRSIEVVHSLLLLFVAAQVKLDRMLQHCAEALNTASYPESVAPDSNPSGPVDWSQEQRRWFSRCQITLQAALERWAKSTNPDSPPRTFPRFNDTEREVLHEFLKWAEAIFHCQYTGSGNKQRDQFIKQLALTSDNSGDIYRQFQARMPLYGWKNLSPESVRRLAAEVREKAGLPSPPRGRRKSTNKSTK